MRLSPTWNGVKLFPYDICPQTARQYEQFYNTNERSIVFPNLITDQEGDADQYLLSGEELNLIRICFLDPVISGSQLATEGIPNFKLGRLDKLDVRLGLRARVNGQGNVFDSRHLETVIQPRMGTTTSPSGTFFLHGYRSEYLPTASMKLKKADKDLLAQYATEVNTLGSRRLYSNRDWKRLIINPAADTILKFTLKEKYFGKDDEDKPRVGIGLNVVSFQMGKGTLVIE